MKYFIIELSDPDFNDIIAVVVESNDTLRYSLDGLNCVVKCSANPCPTVLESHTMYSHAEILPIMHSAEWQDNEI